MPAITSMGRWEDTLGGITHYLGTNPSGLGRGTEHGGEILRGFGANPGRVEKMEEGIMESCKFR